MAGPGNIALTTAAAEPVTLNVGQNGQCTTYGGSLTGTGGMTKIRTGMLTLGGGNTYAGNTTITAGILNAGITETPGVSGPFGAQAANAAGTILFGGGTLQYSAANQFDYSGRFSTAGNQPISIDTNGQTVTFATAIQGAGTSLTLNDSLGTGTLILAASNTYTGGTTVAAGTLQLGDGIANNGYVQGNILNNAAVAFANPAAQTYAGTISGGGALTKIGSGTLTLTGPNTYAGGTTVTGGTLAASSTNVGTGPINLSAPPSSRPRAPRLAWPRIFTRLTRVRRAPVPTASGLAPQTPPSTRGCLLLPMPARAPRPTMVTPA